MQHVGNALLLRRNRGAARSISRRCGGVKSAARRAVEGAAGVVLHQIALRFRLLSAPRFSSHRLWVLQPSDYRQFALPIIGSGVIRLHY